MKSFFRVLLLLLSLIIVYLFFKESPIDPAAFNPPLPEPLEGVLEPNKLLQKAELIAENKIEGPEAIALDDNGVIYTGTQDGKIIKIFPDGKLDILAITKGRPLGMKFHPNGKLIVCDAYKGLLAVDPNGNIEVLSTGHGGVPYAFTDDLDIDSNGIIYFTDASYKYHQNEYLYDLLEARPNGRLLRYNPETKTTDLLLKDLYFANGVALSSNENFLIINETYRYRIRRFWLRGEKAGKSDIFIDNVPGFPDNVTSNRNGLFYVALFTVRNPAMDGIHPYSFLTKLMSKLPKIFWPKPKPYGLVLVLNESGKILKSYQDPTGERLKEITSAVEFKGHLYLGSLHQKKIGKMKLPELTDENLPNSIPELRPF